MEIHQALTRSRTIRNVLPRHEQGGVFAAEGYARSSGKPGVCIATSGPGATNLVSGLADALLDSVPLVAITGQVPRRMIGTDAFQETPIVEVTRSITKHNYLVLDVKLALQGINELLESKDSKSKLDFKAWRVELNEQKMKYPLTYKTFGEAIPPQHAIQVLDELTNGEAIISTGVGQHQMWAAQHYKYKKPRQWLTSAGLGAMGFGLPAAMGAAVANPGAVVVDIDGDGSFIMNVQELATIRVENLPVKIMLLNNQHLGMVVQWEDRFYKANRAHTYLGDPSRESEIFPNMLKFAEACGIPASRVTRIADLRAAIQKMLDTPGPYLLDVIVPHQEHVLPMIPSGGSFKDVITEGDGRTKY
ncbi:unnamed protein product [Linum tenue]|uniref:Acetolactate synthase n=1 Tax=Linum tenue TaxID=586396 RepID=A0AAV0MLV7_9ROSI|nr:unnamed protein product [Linum tenue]